MAIGHVVFFDGASWEYHWICRGRIGRESKRGILGVGQVVLIGCQFDLDGTLIILTRSFHLLCWLRSDECHLLPGRGVLNQDLIIIAEFG
jgi:hypothetical protein